MAGAVKKICDCGVLRMSSQQLFENLSGLQVLAKLMRGAIEQTQGRIVLWVQLQSFAGLGYSLSEFPFVGKGLAIYPARKGPFGIAGDRLAGVLVSPVK